MLIKESLALPLLWIRALVGLCLAIAAFEYISFVLEGFDFGNRLGPILLAIGFVWIAASLIRACPAILLTSLPWSIACAAMYYGIGPLILCYGTDASIASYTYLAISESELLRTNILNISFLLLYFSFYGIFLSRTLVSKDQLCANLSHKSSALVVVWCCGLLGLPIRILLCMPYELGLFNFPLPGAVFQLGNLVTICLLPLWYLIGRGNRNVLPIGVAILLVELFFGFLVFSKSSVVIAILFMLLGFNIGRKDVIAASFGICLILIVYYLVAPIITVCREQRNTVGYIERKSLYEEILLRSAISYDVLTDSSQVRTRRVEIDMQEGWLRLNYSNSQAWVMNKYDQGEPINSYKDALWVVAPRLIFPDKPNMTERGVDLNEMIHGRRTSSMAVGIAAEAYGYGGVFGVLCVSLLVALIMVFVDKEYSMWSQNWLFLPVQVIIIRMGYRFDGALVSDFLGTIVLIACYAFVIRQIDKSFGWSKTVSDSTRLQVDL